jgi:hypothetical protein
VLELVQVHWLVGQLVEVQELLELALLPFLLHLYSYHK